MTTPNTYTNWPNLRSLATVPTSIELLGTTSSNEPVRFLASLLAAQITAGEDGASVRMAYRRTLTVTRPVQPTATRDVSTGVVTLGTPWEWDGPPTGTAPYIWASIANIPADRTENATFDTAFRLNGVDGDDGTPGTNGDDGANGMGVQRIYYATATTDRTPPATPTGGTRANTGLLDTLPSGWSLTPPDGVGYKWASYAGLPGLRTAAPTYTVPFIYEGVDGTQQFIVFVWTSSATTQPTTPAAGDTTVNDDGTALTSTGNSWYHPGNLPDRVEAQPYLWASIALRNPNTSHTVFGAPFRLNGIDGTDGTPGAAGARGDDGRSFVVLYYGNDDPDSGPTDPATWRREPDGTPDFNNPPRGWSASVPSNRHIWIIVATVPGDITIPISFRSSIRITGLDGQAGSASAAGNSQRIIFSRAATPPETPTGGTRRTDGTPDTLPDHWSLNVPSGDDPLYGSVMTVPGDRNTALSFSAPFSLSGEAGARGPQGIDGYGTVPLYYQLTEGTTPSRPTGGSYTGGVLTPPSPWVLNEPAEQPGLDVWIVFAVIAPDGGITYSLPHLPGQDGADGAAGMPGADGANGIATAVVFRRGAIRPDNPAANTGSYALDTGVFTAPAGWSFNVPAGTDVLWGVFVHVNTQADPVTITYSGVFTLGEALNITEIRNDLAALTGDARLPARAISGLTEGHDPRVDALEAATVDLNAVQGRTVQGMDTTDDLFIALTVDEDPNALPDNRWAKNVLATGSPQSIWIRVPETANLRMGSTDVIDLRNYVIQVTSPDESEIIQEFPVSSFDQFGADTNPTYDFLRQGSTATIPRYTWIVTAHVRIRKYNPTDRHSLYTGITVIPDVGSVPDDQRVQGELRRSGDDTLQVFNREGAWQPVFKSAPIDQMDSINLTTAGSWSGAIQIPEAGVALDVQNHGVVSARAQGPLTPAPLGERNSDTFTVPNGVGTVNGWSPHLSGVYDFDITILVSNARIYTGEQPGSLWAEVIVKPEGTPSPAKPVLRGPVVTTRYYEPVEIKVSGSAGVLASDRVYVQVYDAFGVVRWRYQLGEMRVRLTQEPVGATSTGWAHQFLDDYPADVNRHYRPEGAVSGYTQRTLTLYTRGNITETQTDAIQSHTNQLFLGVGYTAHLRRTFTNFEYQTLADTTTTENDQYGGSGNRWIITTQRSGNSWGAVFSLQDANDPFPGAGKLALSVPLTLENPTWAHSSTIADALNSLFIFTEVPDTGIPGGTLLRVPPVLSNNVITINLIGGVEHTTTSQVVSDEPEPPPRTATAAQASVTIRDSNFDNNGRSMTLTITDLTIPLARAGEGNLFTVRFEIGTSHSFTEFVEDERTIHLFTAPLSDFTARNSDTVYLSDFLTPSTTSTTGNYARVQAFAAVTFTNDDSVNGPAASRLRWPISGFAPLGTRAVGDSIAYDFSGGATAGPIAYNGDTFDNPFWGHWFEDDPDPDSEFPLWIALSTATLNPDFNWSYGPWSVFPSGLGSHHTQYAASPNGPWSDAPRTEGFWRHRNADGTWGPAIQLHDAESGTWLYIGHYIIASQASDSDFSTTSTWTDGSGRTVHNHGRVINLTRTFSLDEMSDIGFEFEFWADGNPVPTTANNALLMRYWAQFPVLEDWTTPQPFVTTFPAHEAFLPDPDYTVAWILRRQGTGSNNDEIPVGFAGRPGNDSGYWFGGRRPSNLERWYSSDYMRGGMINLMSESTTDRRFVDRFGIFNRVNNRNQAVRIWAKLR